MNEIKVELALEIMQLKIAHYIKNYKGNNKNEFETHLKELIQEREDIYNLDKKTIDKIYNIYLEEIKKEK